MKIAIALFVYDRSYHTNKVLEALKENTVLPEKLFIFQDGIKPETNRVRVGKSKQTYCKS